MLVEKEIFGLDVLRCDGQGVVIKTSDSDGSKFLSNIMTVLAESRF